MTDIFEGSVIRLARRLDEFLNQVYSKSSLPWYFLCCIYFTFKCSTIMQTSSRTFMIP